MKLSINALISYSIKPLFFGIYAGIFFILFSFFLATYSIIMLMKGNSPAGYTTLIVFVALAFGILFIIIGIPGIYIDFIFEEKNILLIL